MGEGIIMKRSALWVSLCVVVLGVGGIALSNMGQGVAFASDKADDRAEASAKPDSSKAGGYDRDKCFDPKFTDGFQTVNDHKVVITSDRDEPYELTVMGPCMGLDSTFALGLRTKHGAFDVCGPFDAEIVYRDMGELRTCQIASVRHLTGDEAAPYKRSRRGASGASSSR